MNKRFEKRGDSSSLVVLVHGFVDAESWYAGILQEVRAAQPNADILQPLYRKGRFHNEDPFAVADELEAEINDTYNASKAGGNPYKSILLIGYSLGALLIRKAYVYGRGSEEDREGSGLPFTPANEWTDHVERIILLAGVNRGWSMQERPSSMSWLRYRLWRVAARLLRPLPVLGIIKKIERGSPFVANLRVQWVRLIQNTQHVAQVVQLLGTADTLVDSADDADLYVHSGFLFIPVEGASHATLLQFAEEGLGKRCRDRFVEALTTDIPVLKEKYKSEQHVTHEDLDQSEQHIVFVMHGIRDTGGWTVDLGNEIVKQAGQLGIPRPHVVTSKYTYFPFIRFLLSRLVPKVRVANVLAFMDDYTEYLAKFPGADSKVSFIGHSHGTYILASALEQYKTLHIHHASFAGSVVRRGYPWKKIITDEGRVQKLRNDIAIIDYAVGIFPKTFEQFHLSDVGSGGFDGFLDTEANENEGRYYKGGHSAAIRPKNFPSLANFILTGNIERDETLMTTSSERPWWMDVPSKFSIVVWALVLAAAFGLVYLFFALWGLPGAIAAILVILLVIYFF